MLSIRKTGKGVNITACEIDSPGDILVNDESIRLAHPELPALVADASYDPVRRGSAGLPRLRFRVEIVLDVITDAGLAVSHEFAWQNLEGEVLGSLRIGLGGYRRRRSGRSGRDRNGRWQLVPDRVGAVSCTLVGRGEPDDEAGVLHNLDSTDGPALACSPLQGLARPPEGWRECRLLWIVGEADGDDSPFCKEMIDARGIRVKPTTFSKE